MELLLSPTGVLHWNQKKALAGYSLIAPTFSTKSYLLDMEGDIVHEWQHKTRPGLYAELLPNGNLLRGLRPEPAFINFGGYSGGVEELDWQGNVIWSYELNERERTHHHCFKRLENGNTFILAWECKSREESLAKGRKPETLSGDAFSHDNITYTGLVPDYVIEVNPQGKTVWEWHTWDHIGTGPEQFDINYKLPDPSGYFSGPDWSHFNSIDYDQRRDILLLNSRNFGEFYLIDHKTGKMLYRWGNPTAYRQGQPPTFGNDGGQILFGPHHATFLENGNILLFDNGWIRPELNRSRIIEMNPATGKIVWEYSAVNPNSFSSPLQGACQRLQNGNTLVTSSQTGHIFEVTQEKEIVWVFVNPWSQGGIAKRILHDASESSPKLASSNYGAQFNMTHRAARYSKDYIGLRGKKLEKIRHCVDAPYWFKEYADLYQKDLFDIAAQEENKIAK